MSLGDLGLTPRLVLVYVGVTSPQDRVLELRDCFLCSQGERIVEFDGYLIFIFGT